MNSCVVCQRPTWTEHWNGEATRPLYERPYGVEFKGSGSYGSCWDVVEITLVVCDDCLVRNQQRISTHDTI